MPSRARCSVSAVSTVPDRQSVRIISDLPFQRLTQGEAYLSLRKRPKVNPHAYQIIQACIRSLVEQQGRQRKQRVDYQPRLDAPVDHGPREQRQGPFEAETDDAEQQIEDLKDGRGLDSRVEGFCQKVPEDLGPEEAFYRGFELVCNEPCQLCVTWEGGTGDTGRRIMEMGAVPTYRLQLSGR